MPSPISYRIKGLDRLDPRRILLLQQRQIGDVLLLTPTIHMLKERFPQASIDVLTEAKCAPVLENNPEVARVWEIDRSLGFFAALRFYRHVGTGGGHGRFDLAIDFQQLPRLRWVLALSDAPVKLSYPPPWYNRPFYTHWAPVSGPYAAKCKAGVVMHALGLEWKNDPPRIWLTEAERARASELLAAWGLGPGERLLSLDVTHRSTARRWPAEHFAGFIRLAAEARPGLKFLIVFGPGEEAMAREVAGLAEAAGTGGSVLLQRGAITLRELAALLERADLHVGNCSAPRHFALAVGTRTLTLPGASSNAWTYPGPGHEDVMSSLPCQPCGESECPEGHYRCLRDVGPEQVLARALALLDQPPGQ